MTRKAPLVAVLAIGATALAPAALAKKPATTGKGRLAHAKVLRGTLSPVRADVAAYTRYTGRAQLVANKRNANVVVKVRHLVPRTAYAWALLEGDCAGAPAAGLKYRAIRTGGAGNGVGKASSKKGRFRRDLATGYSVVVMQAGTTTEPLLCGALTVKRQGTKGGKGGKGGGGKGGGGKGRGPKS